jgi:hypothetical protein
MGFHHLRRMNDISSADRVRLGAVGPGGRGSGGKRNYTNQSSAEQ